MHRAVRGAVRPLINSPVTPNHLTTARLVTGLAAAGAFALDPGFQGQAPEFWNQVGAGLFLLSLLLDRADGELARQSGKTSDWGHRYDLITDTTCNALVFVGIGIGLRGGVLGGWAVAMGLAAGIGVAAILWLVMSAGPEPAGAPPADNRFDPDDGMVAVPLVMALGGALPLLVAAAVGTPAFAIHRYRLYRREKSAARGGQP